MLLKNLIKNCPKEFEKKIIKGLAIDSRKIKKGFIFFALTGSKLEGTKFINHAIKKGASVIICNSGARLKLTRYPILKVKNVQKALAQACCKFYKDKPRNVIAVTGTNGKSSVANFFLQIFNLNKIPAASIGTLGTMQKNKIKRNQLTTPDIVSLHKELYNLKRQGVNNVIVEASSHGLQQGRLDGINYKAGIFTNFSQDHLDYHKSLNNYFNSKMILFSILLKKNNYLITDSNLKEFSKIKNICKNKKKLIDINKKKYKIYNFDEKFRLLGDFQFKNLMMSIIASNICGISLKKISSIIKNIRHVDGRLELIKTLPNKAKIYVDYAHTPDALACALKTLKENYNSKLSIVFGCGGNRDRSKRKKMAIIAKKYCDQIYVTDDNPRYENPKKIREEIIRYLDKKKSYNIGDRRKAIEKAISNSNFNELILIAGKGHEDHQDYGKKRFNFSDKITVKKINFKKKYQHDNFNSYLLNQILKNKKKINFEGVTIDSRSCKKNNLFVALRGKNHNGNKFVNNAKKNGASLCIGTLKRKQKKYVQVNNTLKFLEKLALLKRKKIPAKVIAITGSAGKTTMKFMIGKILGKYGKTYFPPKSYNNNIGVPLSMSNLEYNHEYGVFEIGMNKPGEINSLSKIVKPDIAIITNIAEAHIENFKDLSGIAKEKSSIINHVVNGGTIILNRSDKYFSYMFKKSKRKNLKIITFGYKNNADIFPIKIKSIGNKEYYKINYFNKIINLESKSSKILNILTTLAVLKSLNLDVKYIQKFFLNFNNIDGRGKIFSIKSKNKTFKLIDESYNANPLSVKEAINGFSKIKTIENAKKYILLGDMLELGKKSELYHKRISKIINNSNINKFFALGHHIINTFKFVKKTKRGNILHSEKDFEEVVQPILKRNDYIMIKGSNATGLNQITKRLIKSSRYAL